MWLALALLLALPRVSLVVTPRVVQAGQSVHIKCRVPRHPDNRRLEFGLVEWSVSVRELAGERAEVIWPTVAQVPCVEEVVAYCFLTSTTRTFTAAAPVQVTCQDWQASVDRLLHFPQPAAVSGL